jgi:hypothetical protein
MAVSASAGRMTGGFGAVPVWGGKATRSVRRGEIQAAMTVIARLEGRELFW